MQVKEDVAWLLEDTSDGGWKPVKDDGHVKVRYKQYKQHVNYVVQRQQQLLL